MESVEVLGRFRQAHERFVKDLGAYEARVADSRKLTETLSVANHRIEVRGKALLILEAVATSAQKTIRDLIDAPVTAALQTVYEDGSLSFRTEIERVGDRMEVDFKIFRSGEETPGPVLDSEGGGLADIISFTMRVCLFRLLGGRGPLVLDEPFRHVSGQALPRAGEFARQVADSMGIQMVMVTHSPVLASEAVNTIQLVSRGKVKVG